MNMARLVDREFPDHDGRVLRTFCGDEIPQHVRIAYWHYKSIKDKGGLSACSAEELCMVVLMARMMLDEAPQDNPLKHFDIAKASASFDQFAENNVRIWFKKKEMKAQFIEHFPERKETKVLLYEDVSERTLPDERILGLWPEVKQPVEA